MAPELADTSNAETSREEKRKSRKSSKKVDEVEIPGTDTGGKKKKRKERKRTADAEAVEEHGEAAGKRKKRHRKEGKEDGSPDVADSGVPPPELEVVEDDGPREKEKKRKDKGKKREKVAEAIEPPNIEGESDDERPKDKKKRKKDGKALVVAEEEGKKKKRKKDSDADAATNPESPKDSDSKEKEHKRKKRKHSKNGFPNPDEDEDISDQAKKALVYAYMQAEDPADWKFSKARQNWLIRNVWSDAAVPEKYVPLVKRYLAGVQGGAREAFIKTCRTFALSVVLVDSPNADGVAAQPPETNTMQLTADAVSNMKKQRARELLEALTVPEDL